MAAVIAVATKTPRTSELRRAAIAAGYRSGLEEELAEQLTQAGVAYSYEEKVIPYTKPESKHRYTPDFVLPNGIIIESKGRFVTEDRQKHILIKAQHPDLDIRFVFTRSKTTISKTSKTTYADWCVKHGFLFADRRIPAEWLSEPPKNGK